jgi:hypothetical protein
MPLVGASSITVMCRGCSSFILLVDRFGSIALEDERQATSLCIC